MKTTSLFHIDLTTYGAQMELETKQKSSLHLVAAHTNTTHPDVQKNKFKNGSKNF